MSMSSSRSCSWTACCEVSSVLVSTAREAAAPTPLTRRFFLAPPPDVGAPCDATKDNRRAIINTALDAEAILRAGALLYPGILRIFGRIFWAFWA